MTKAITIYILTFLISVASYGQDEVELYTAIFQKSDSLKRLGHISYIDSSVFFKALDLDKQHPSKYFETAGECLKNSEFNEASFLFYLGILRFQYYNAVNPKYKSKDGEDFWVLQFTYIELVETYMHTDVDNFVFILCSIKWN